MQNAHIKEYKASKKVLEVSFEKLKVDFGHLKRSSKVIKKELIKVDASHKDLQATHKNSLTNPPSSTPIALTLMLVPLTPLVI
jgi:hypothetical protein